MTPATAARRPGPAAVRRPRHRLADVLAFALPLTVYLMTAAPTVYNLDSAELTTAAATGGIVRATGYPLYLLIGRVWSELPIGDVGFRMNLLSALFGATTIFLGHRLLQRLGVGLWAAAGALGLLAASRYFWAMSLVAEVYTLHTALVAGIVLLLLRWQERPTPARLAAATFVVGLASGNHVATVLLAPGCLWFVLASDRRTALSWRSLTAAAAGLAAGLSIYLYLPLLFLARPVFNYAGHYDASGAFVPVDLTTAAGLWWIATGRVFAGQMLAYSGAELLAEIGHFAAELWRAFLAVGIGPGILGAALLARRRPPLGISLVLMFVVTAGFYIDYRVVDKNTMFLGVYLIWALWAGVGYQWLEDLLTDSDLRGGRSALRVVMLAAVATAVAWNGPRVDLSDDWSTRRRGEAILAELEPGALFAGFWDSVPVVEYLQMVEGRRPDVDAINRFLMDDGDLVALLAAELGKRPLYLDDISGEPLDGVLTVPAGPVRRVVAVRAPTRR
ncbi:MAG TPA: DUF2723 domain-containing protein [Candidatus Sulfomarinibacteraceae bacterium]|nr:DUF2723 domain-containing protein [Candidatus Sulfomarinibacteraceae bacterium]